MRQFFVLVKRELVSIRKEKTILMAVFVQLFIALLSSTILEGVMAFYDPNFIDVTSGNIRIGTVADQGEPLAEYMEDAGIIVIRYDTYDDARSAFDASRIDAFVVFPEAGNTPVTIQLYLPEHDSRKTALLLIIDIPLKRYEYSLRQNDGINVTFNGLENHPFSPFEFVYTVLIPLLILFPALVAGSMVIDGISEEFENNTLDTLLSSPVTPRQVFSSMVTVSVVVAVIQIGLWLLLLSWNGISIQNVPLVILLGASYAVTISLSSAMIAVLLKDRQRSQFIFSMVLIVIGAGSFFLSASPIDLLTKLASGAPEISYLALTIFVLIPFPLWFLYHRIAALRR